VICRKGFAMRLTLRTLLAYLDDVMGPAETREIGQKLQNSPVALSTVNRIKEVIRRRRLSAPELSGPAQGIAPTVVAQYLDNTLSPENVAEVEQVCLVSDEHLAEMAACHQILSTLPKDSLDVAGQGRDRFYALGPYPVEQVLGGGATSAARAPTAPSTPSGRPIPDRSIETELLDELRSESLTQRWLPAVGVTAVVAAALMLLFMDWDMFRSVVGPGTVASRNAEPTGATGRPGDRQIASESEPQRPPSPPPGASIAAVGSTPQAIDRAADGTGEASPGPLDGTTNRDPAAGLPDAPLPADMVAPNRSSAAVAVADRANPGAASSDAPAAAAAVESDPAPAAPIAATMLPLQIRDQSTTGVRLRLEAFDRLWHVLPPRSELAAGDEIAVPEPFEAKWDVGSNAVRVRVLGGTRVRTVAASRSSATAPLTAVQPNVAETKGPEVTTPPADPADGSLPVGNAASPTWGQIELQRGRLVVQPGPMDGDGPWSVVVILAGQPQLFQLLTRDTQLGIASDWCEPDGAGNTVQGPCADVTLSVVSGRVGLPGAAINELGVGSFKNWSPIAAGLEAISEEIPDWLTNSDKPAAASAQRLVKAFEDAFDPDQSVDLCLPAVAKDPNPKLAELAIQAQALLDDYSALTAGLATSIHEEVRKHAAAALHGWLRQSPDHDATLRTELESHYSPTNAATVLRLLWGLTPQQARDRIESLQLVAELDNERPEIRELAFAQLVHLTKRTYEYRPMGPPATRERAITRWEQHIHREGALLPPETVDADPTAAP
jgi:hypothetical protein